MYVGEESRRGQSVRNYLQGRDQKTCSGIVIDLGSSHGVWRVILFPVSERRGRKTGVFLGNFESVCD